MFLQPCQRLQISPDYILLHKISSFKGIIGSLSNNVFECRTSTGSGLFSFFDSGFAQIFSQIASITVKKLRNTNFISSRHVKRENTSLPVDVRRSKTSLLKLPNDSDGKVNNRKSELGLPAQQFRVPVFYFRVPGARFS